MREGHAGYLALDSLKCVVIYRDTRFFSLVLSGRIVDLGL